MKKGWVKRTLQEVCYKITDGTHQTPKYFDEGIIFLSSRNVKSGRIDWDNIKYVDEKQHIEFHKRVAPKPKDILLAKNGTTGVAAMVDRDVVFDIYVSLAHIRVKDEVLPEYMLHFINSPLAKDQFNKRLKGVGVPNLHLNEIREVAIPFPKSLPEQRTIVALLDAAFANIDQAKANIERNMENARELFQSKLNEIFSQRGEGWEERKLGDFAEFRNGLNYKKSSTGETIKIVGVGDFQQHFFIPFETLNSVEIQGELNEIDELKDGDILAVRSNGNPELIGRCILASGVEGKISHSGFTIRIRLNDNSVYPPFLCHFLKSTKAKNQLINSGTGISIKSLNQGSLASLTLPLPKSVALQKELTKKLSVTSELAEKLAFGYLKKLEALDDLKKSLLQKAFAGELTHSAVLA